MRPVAIPYPVRGGERSYSNKTRGQRAQRQPAAAAGTGIPARSPTAREARKGWAALIKQVYEADPLCCPKCGTTMRIIAFLERRQTEVIEKLRCAKRTSILGKLTGRAWEAHSPALWALGGGCRPGPTAAGGSGRGLTEQETQEKAGDCTRRSGERSAHRAGASSTGVAPAFRTPLQPSRSLAEPAAAMGSRPAQSPWRQGGVSGLNPAPFPLEQPHPSGDAATTRKSKFLSPNCLSNGREFAIFDHELAFFMDGILGWKPPWEPCAIQFPKGLPSAVRHVFLEELRGQPTDLRRLAGAFEAVSRSRLNEYRAALPAD
jgi:hypothetical protein